jgi:hypothetical protein
MYGSNRKIVSNPLPEALERTHESSNHPLLLKLAWYVTLHLLAVLLQPNRLHPWARRLLRSVLLLRSVWLLLSVLLLRSVLRLRSALRLLRVSLSLNESSVSLALVVWLF